MFKKLWKAFCNIDIMGKIYILIISFIVIVAIITVVVRYANAGKQEEQVNKDFVDVTESLQVDIAEGVDTTPTDEVLDNTENVLETSQEVKSTPTVSTTPVVKAINEEKETTTDNKAQEVIQTKEPVIEDTNNENNNQETNNPVEVEKPVQTGAKYVVNNEMINKMKTYIENNPSEDMQTYGFTVVSDNSIKSLTNRFYIYRKKDKLFNIIKMWNYKNICRRLLL